MTRYAACAGVGVCDYVAPILEDLIGDIINTLLNIIGEDLILNIIITRIILTLSTDYLGINLINT